MGQKLLSFVFPARQAEVVCLFHSSLFAYWCPEGEPLWRGDEPPMTACGGNLIGGEISRNKQCPHQADLRRLRLRTTGPGAESEGA